ncbi:hypothetical protein PAPHI01_0218 [Pancytospora philotis]|nr:hypothetical protein PAPHI01_0218 [Pancytospora philotis]
MRPIKREYADERVDFVFLIEQWRMLTADEYAAKQLAQPYARYQEVYYQRRIAEVYGAYKDAAWFSERYLSEGERAEQPRPEQPPSVYVVVESVSERMAVPEIHKCFGSSADVLATFIEQKGMQAQYKRDVYLQMAADCDVEAFIGAIGEQYRAYAIDLNSLPMEDLYTGSLEEARAVYRALCRLQRCGLDAAAGMASTGEVVKALQDDFFYCLTCARKYDSYVAMRHVCSTHRADSLNARAVKLLTAPKDFSKVYYPYEARDIDRNLIRLSGSDFKCALCSKTFEGIDCITNHLVSRHPSVLEETDRNKRSFYRFVDGIDCFALALLEGTCDKRLPHWISGPDNGGKVVYDFPHLFSGEIVLE